MSDQAPIHLGTRLALRQAELAQALGISERAVRSVASQLPRVYLGRIPLFPVRAIEVWLAERATAGQAEQESLLDEVLGSVDD